MKKAKTIFLSLVIMLASAFMSACSCMDNGNVTQVNETNITVRCIESDGVTATEENQKITIDINKGLDFMLEYTLSPSNVTTTQVDWVINNTAVVSSNIYTLSKSAQETVQFKAKKEGKATITFTTFSTKKKAVVDVIVHKEKEALPILSAPKDIKFNNQTGTISWSAVTSYTNGLSALVDSNGTPVSIANGLVGYVVKINEYNSAGGVVNTEIREVDATTTSITDIPVGKRYGIIVTAKGDENYLAKSSTESSEYKYMKLATPTVYFKKDKVKSKDFLCFVMSDNAGRIEVFNNETSIGSINAISGATIEKDIATIVTFNPEIDNVYRFMVQAFPSGYAEGLTIKDVNGFEVYPSEKTSVEDALDVIKFAKPTIALSSVTTNEVKIGGSIINSRLYNYTFNKDASYYSHNEILINLPEGAGAKYVNFGGFNCKYEIITPSEEKIEGQATLSNSNSDLAVISTKDWQKEAGEYTIKVWIEGKEEKSIKSDDVEVKVYQLPMLSRGDVEFNGDYITVKDTIGNARGVEFYFVNANPTTVDELNSFNLYKFVSFYDQKAILDLSNLDFGEEGDYKFYCRLVGNSAESLTTTTPDILQTLTSGVVYNTQDDTVGVNDKPIRKLSAPKSILVKSDWSVDFELADYDRLLYKASINFDSGSGTYSNGFVDVVLYPSGNLGYDDSVASLPYIRNTSSSIKTGTFDLREAIIRLIKTNIQGAQDFNIDMFEDEFKNNSEISVSISTMGTGFPSADEIKAGAENVYTISSNGILKSGNTRTVNVVNFGVDATSTRDNIKFKATLENVSNYNFYAGTLFTLVVCDKTFTNVKGDIDGGFVFDPANIYVGSNKTNEKDEKADTMLDVIIDFISNTENTNKFRFEIFTQGIDSQTNSGAIFNSATADGTLEYNGKVVGLNVNEAGILTWNAQEFNNISGWVNKAFSVDDRFIVKFYDGETLIDSVDYDISLSEETASHALDISEILDSNIGKVIGIIVTQTNYDGNKLNGLPSEMFFAKRLDTTNITRESGAVISWTAVEGASGYVITCDQAVFGDEEKTTSITVGSNVTDLDVSFLTVVGEYNFSINATAENIATNGLYKDSPYILAGKIIVGDKNPTIKVNVLSGNIDAYANGNSVEWSHISGATYLVSYKTETTDWARVANVNIEINTNSGKVSFDASNFNAEKYSIEIIPSVDFVQSGIILKHTPGHISTVEKMNSVEELTASGVVKFVYNTNGASDLVFKLFTVSDETLSVVSSTNYKLENDGANYTIDLVGMPAGSYTFAIQVVANGYIDGDLVIAENPFTKVQNISDFGKVGDYLVWTEIAPATGVYANRYIIRALKDGGQLEEIYLKVNKTGGVVLEVGTITATGIEYAQTSDFIYDATSGKFGYKFKLGQDAVAGDYLYTIKPIVEVENYLNGQFVSSTVTVLNNNVTAEIENGKIKFGAFVQDGSFAPSLVEIVVQKYTMQEVTITPESGEPETKTVKVPVDGAIIDYTGVNAIPFDNYNAGYIIDLNDFENMQEDGLYYVTVQFIGNGNNVVDSLKYENTNFEKRTTTVFGMQNGALTLGETVANVTDYSVKIVNANEDVVATFNFTPDSTKTLPAELKDNGKTVTGFEAFVEGEDVIAENTLYTIYVKANGGASALDGKWSTGFKFMRLPAPKNVRLDKENVVYGSDTSIIWDSYSYNATGFEIKFKDEMTSMYQAEGSTVITKWELKPDKPEGVYNLQLRAIGNTTSSAVGMLTSYYSAISSDATVSYIRNDTNPTSANGIVTWQDLSTSGVVGYKVKGENQATGQNFEKYVTATSLNVVNSAEDITENGIVNSIVNFTDGGIWVLSVEAVTDRTAVVTNIDAENHDKFASIYKPFAPSNYKILNGMLAWEYSVENLKNYISWLIPTGTPTTTDVVKYVYDAVNLGSNTTSLGVNLSFMYSLKLNINGVSTEDKPTSVVALDSTGAQIIDESAFGTAKTLRFIYDVAMQTDFSADGEAGSTVTNTAGIEYKAGYYKIAVSLASTHNVDGEIVYTDIVNSAYSGIIEAYKPNTPKSWFDKASTEDDLNGGMEVQEESGDGEDDNSDITDDGAGEEETKPADTYIDILNGKALWELSVINDEFTNSSGDAIPGISYYKDYTLTARSVQNETSASVNITISSDDENISDKYKYSRDIKEIFYNENAQGENDKYLVKLNEAYKLYVYARGTADSALLDSNAPKFLNSNVYEFSNQINILDIQNPMVDESTLVMPKGYGSLSTNAYIYGPLNKEYELVINTDENGIKTEVIRAKTNSENTQEDWMSSAKSIELLAKIRYANSNITNDFTYWEVLEDHPALKGLNKGSAEYTNTLNGIINRLKTEVENPDENKILKYLFYKENFTDEEGAGVGYTLTNNTRFENGGYAIYTQDIGDGRGIVDSPISNVVYSYKLDKVTKVNDSWLGTGDCKGMFVWNPVPLANAYKVNVYEISAANEGQVVLVPELSSNGYVYDEEYMSTESGRIISYDLPSDTRSYILESGFNENKYYLEIIACRVERTLEVGGAYTYDIEPNFFSSDTMNMYDDNASAYQRLSIPTDIYVNENGSIDWNNENEILDVANYTLYYNDSLEPSARTDNNIPTITLPNEDFGTITIQIRAIALENKNLLNSSKSISFAVTKIAEPVLKVENGDVMWYTEGGDLSGREVARAIEFVSYIGETAKVVEEIEDTTKLGYQYFADIANIADADSIKNYRLSNDLDVYPEGNAKVTVRFMGNEGRSDKLKENETFYLSSSEQEIYVNKLTAPVVQNHVNTGTLDANKIKWQTIAHASGYKVLVYDKNLTNKYEYILRDTSVKLLINGVEVTQGFDGSYSTHFNVDATYTYFNLTDLLTNRVGGTANGIELRVHVQALGITNSDGFGTSAAPALISSSYSDYIVVAVPAQPISAYFDNNTGVLTWELQDNNKEGFNIIITSEYKVAEVTNDELTNYWKPSSDRIGDGNINDANVFAQAINAPNIKISTGFEEIKQRLVVYSQVAINNYTIAVRDVILLTCRDNDNITPTHYSITAVGYDYYFGLVTTAYEEAEGDNSTYKSTMYEYCPDNQEFLALFDKGNGSEKYPYVIKTKEGLNAIRYFADRYFVIDNDINYNGTWNTIEKDFVYNVIKDGHTIAEIEFDGTFTGVVDGQNHYVYNLNSTSLNSAFVEENAGTIKNLNLQVDFQAKEITNATGTPKMAGVAILNTGLIDNVHVGKYVVSGGVSFESIISIDKISLGVAVEATASRVGGIASRSTGIISNSSVDANIYAVDSVRQGTSAGNAAFAGGIVAELDGTEDKAEIKAKIINSYFAGNITSNIVGGIASAVSGDVEIERCYIKEFVDSEEVDRTILTGTDLNTSEYSIYERIIVGGLVAMTTSGSKVAIYDSYSLATIYIERNENDNNNTSIGGIVAFVHNSTSSLNIDGCYVLINAYSNIDNTGELVTLYGLTPNKPTSTQGVVSGYYIIHEENAISVENGVGEQVTTEQLKTKLDSGVYDIESEGYPTLK